LTAPAAGSGFVQVKLDVMTMKGSAVASQKGAPVGEEIDPEAGAVHAWRVSQLVRLGLAWHAAEAVADRVDWHEVARLVQRGCPATLAAIIVG
jgi:hypothetical protein